MQTGLTICQSEKQFLWEMRQIYSLKNLVLRSQGLSGNGEAITVEICPIGNGRIWY